MSTRKLVWEWKAKNCPEVSENFDVPFAVKEYIQNQVGQVLKETKSREWSEWKREDLTGSTQAARKQRKISLGEECSGLLTGPHGAHIKRTKDWEPIFILSATVPHYGTRSDMKPPSNVYLRSSPYPTSLEIRTVMWKNSSTGNTGFTFYNNHLDQKARFHSFVADGASTSRGNVFAVGEKGKGFALATQFMYEKVKRHFIQQNPMMKIPKSKVSFRVGHEIGELKWKSYQDEDVLRVTRTDLTPVDPYRTTASNTENDHQATPTSEADSAVSDAYSYNKGSTITRKTGLEPTISDKNKAKKIYKDRFTYQLASKSAEVAAGKDSFSSHDELPHVTADEVCISILDLPGDIQPGYAFSCIYGIISPHSAWPVEDSKFIFFKPAEGSNPTFFHRDQLVPSGLPVNTIGINYHGDLKLSADRVSVLHHNTDYRLYRSGLGSAVDKAFRTMPELAVQLAVDMLKDNRNGPGSIIQELSPRDKTAGDAYRTAFLLAWRIVNPALPIDGRLYPCAPDEDGDNNSDGNLVRELDMEPVIVSSREIRDILRDSGAFLTVKEYAKGLLLAAPIHDKRVYGIERLRTAMTHLLPGSSIFVKEYRHSYPKIAWDAEQKSFVLGLPDDCAVHDPKEQPCLCWVGPCVDLAVKTWTCDRTDKDLAIPTHAGIWRSTLLAMVGVVDMQEPLEAPAPAPAIDNHSQDDSDINMHGPGNGINSGPGVELEVHNDGDGDDDDDDDDMYEPRLRSRRRQSAAVISRPRTGTSDSLHTLSTQPSPSTTRSEVTAPADPDRSGKGPSMPVFLNQIMTQIQSFDERDVRRAVTGSTGTLLHSVKKLENEVFVLRAAAAEKQSTIEELQRAVTGKQSIIEERERELAVADGYSEHFINEFNKRRKQR